MNTNRVNLDQERQDQIKDAARTDLREDNTLVGRVTPLLAGPPLPLLRAFTNVEALIDSWVVGLYPDPAEQDIAREEVYNAAANLIKQEVGTHSTEYKNKNTSLDSSATRMISAFRNLRSQVRTQHGLIAAANPGALPDPSNLLALLMINKDHVLGRQPLPAPFPAAGGTVTNLLGIETNIMNDIMAEFNTYSTALMGVTIDHSMVAPPITADVINAAIRARNEVLSQDTALHDAFDSFRQAARDSLTTHNGVNLNLNELRDSVQILDRIQSRVQAPSRNEVADRLTRFKNMIPDFDNTFGHGVNPYAFYFPVRTPLGNGYARGRHPSPADMVNYTDWVLQNRNSSDITDEVKQALDANAQNTLNYYIDFGDIQRRIGLMTGAQMTPANVRAFGPAAVEEYLNDTGYYTAGVQGFAPDATTRNGLLNYLAWHFKIEPGTNRNSQIYQKLTDQLITNLGFVTDDKTRKEITKENIDYYTEFSKRGLRRGSRVRARRAVLTARFEDNYQKVAKDFEGQQASSAEVQKKLTIQLVKEVMKGRYDIIQAQAETRSENFFERTRRKLAAHPVKRFLRNSVVGGAAIGLAASGLIAMSNPVTAAGAAVGATTWGLKSLTWAGAAASGLFGLSIRNAGMSVLDLAQAKMSRAKGRSRSAVTGRRDPATGLPVGGMAGRALGGGLRGRYNRHKTQDSLARQIALAEQIGADFTLGGKNEFSIDSDSHEKQLGSASDLWKAEERQLESTVRDQITAGTTPPRNDSPQQIIYNSLSEIYSNGGIEDRFLALLEKRKLERRSALNVNQLVTLGAGITAAGLFGIKL